MNKKTRSNLWEIFIIFVIIINVTLQVEAQSFYPSNVGNKWVYDEISTTMGGFYSRETTHVSITGDTLMPNGFLYSKFKIYDRIGGYFIRTDTNWVYYYNHWDSTDVPFFKLNATVSEQWNVNLGRWFFVTYLGSDSVTIFNTSTKIKGFYLDGLAVMYVYLSDKFGLFFVRDMHDPPGAFITDNYLIGAIISDTSYGFVVSVKNNNNLVTDYNIEQNFPNPFNSRTIIEYHIPRKEFVSIKVYDLRGQEIISLVNEIKDRGSYRVMVNADQFPSSVYFYRIKAGNFTTTRKMLLTK